MEGLRPPLRGRMPSASAGAAMQARRRSEPNTPKSVCMGLPSLLNRSPEGWRCTVSAALRIMLPAHIDAVALCPSVSTGLEIIVIGSLCAVARCDGRAGDWVRLRNLVAPMYRADFAPPDFVFQLLLD
jgi:hypothetical protein